MSRSRPSIEKNTALSPRPAADSTALIDSTAQAILKYFRIRPRLAIVLGSGYNDVAALLKSPRSLPYRDLPGLPLPTVPGHAGALHCGMLENVSVLVFNGRTHYYEGYAMDQVTMVMRLLPSLGIDAVILTNAAGGINPRFRRGEFMVLTDHINFLGVNPLRGMNHQGMNRFVDLTHVYDRELQKILERAAREIGIRLRSGVYLGVSGPTYETPAEIRAFRRMGADAVGMSTVAEAIVARAVGVRVAGLSAITNLAAGMNKDVLSHPDVLRQGQEMSRTAADLLTTFVRLYGNCSTGLAMAEKPLKAQPSRLSGNR